MVKRVVEGIGAKPPADIRANAVARFLGELRNDSSASATGEMRPGISITTSNNLLTAIKGFVAWLAKERRRYKTRCFTCGG